MIAFEIGFKSYIAFDGYNAGIYELTEDGWDRQNVANSNFDHIHYWLPVPVQTYRDEVILFAQRSLDHGTHTTHVVEVIINNGGEFFQNKTSKLQLL